MDCPECEAATIRFPLSDELAGILPGEEAGAALCPNCLRLHPVGEPPAEPDSFEPLGDGYPQEPGAAVPMAVLLGLLDSLALNRSSIAELLDVVEREGVDPLLVIDRLREASHVQSHMDLHRRRRQLEQLID